MYPPNPLARIKALEKPLAVVPASGPSPKDRHVTPMRASCVLCRGQAVESGGHRSIPADITPTGCPVRILGSELLGHASGPAECLRLLLGIIRTLGETLPPPDFCERLVPFEEQLEVPYPGTSGWTAPTGEQGAVIRGDCP